MSVENALASFTGDPPAAAQDRVMPDRRELALVAVERTRMPMVVSDPTLPDNPIVLANTAFLQLTGYSAEEVLGRNCRFLQGRETSPTALAHLRTSLARGDEYIELELLNYRKDGSSFWNQLVISEIRDDHGKLLYHFASQKDVSARRESQALFSTQRRLLMEVDHRALNTLALVQSIVSLSKADSEESLQHVISRRINSMARAHQLLAKQHWHAVSLEDTIRTQIRDHISHRVVVQGQAVSISAHNVQPLALVLHELLSNAQLHGALASDEGVVELSWIATDATLQLFWKEGPLSFDDNHYVEKLGLTIVRSLVENQLNGRLIRKQVNGVLNFDLVLVGVSGDA